MLRDAAFWKTGNTIKGKDLIKEKNAVLHLGKNHICERLFPFNSACRALKTS